MLYLVFHWYSACSGLITCVRVCMPAYKCVCVCIHVCVIVVCREHLVHCLAWIYMWAGVGWQSICPPSTVFASSGSSSSLLLWLLLSLFCKVFPHLEKLLILYNNYHRLYCYCKAYAHLQQFLLQCNHHHCCYCYVLVIVIIAKYLSTFNSFCFDAIMFILNFRRVWTTFDYLSNGNGSDM